MSLINEALRKARREAAERDATERGVSYRPPRAHLPTERSWLPALLGGVALGALVAAVAFFVLVPEESAVPARSPITTEPAAELQSNEASAAGSDPIPQPIVASDPESEPRIEPQPELEPSRQETPPSQPSESAQVAAEPLDDVGEALDPDNADDADNANGTDDAYPAKGSEAQRIRPPEQVGQIGEQTYVLEAEIDGVFLRLDFIVWAPANPFAQINGRQVSVGQTVDGFLVRSIRREEVTLEGDGGPFRLRVR